MASARSVRHRLHNLPARRTTLIGREHDLRHLRELILDGPGRLVTLTGAGGCGKTRLACAVADEVVGAFQDGARLIEFAAVSDPRLVPQTVASALGVEERSGRVVVESLSIYLEQRQILLVFDNCEHLVGACAELADRLLDTCSSVRILATSREPLRIAGETLWRVPSLGVTLPHTDSPADLMQVASVRLFVERAQAVQPTFALGHDNAPAVAAICVRLGGLPLAIELAAAWERTLGVQEILLRLDDMFALLVGGSRTHTSRQQTLWATLEWSHALLAPPAQVFFRRLPVFAGGWSLADAEAVCAGEEVSQADVLRLLARLVDTSLVLEEERDGYAHFRMLEPVRAFAAHHLGASGETESMLRAHAHFFFDHALELTSKTCAPAEMARRGPRLDQMAREFENFRTALGWFADNGPVESTLRFANALADLWQHRGYLIEGRSWMTRLLAQPGGEAGTRARALGWAGNFAWFQGDPIAARVLHGEALTLDRQIGDEEHTARVLGALSRDALALGDYRTAEQLGEQALRLCYALDVGIEELWTLYTLGIAAYAQGNWDTAAALHTRSLERAAAFGGLPPLEGMACYGLARVAHHERQFARARAMYEEALATQRALDEPGNLALTLLGLGLLLLDLQDVGSARAALAESLALHERLGDTSGLASSFDGYASLAVVDDQHESAWRVVGAADRLRAAGQTPRSPTDEAELARRLEPARRALGDEAVLTLRASGRALSTPQAMALARSREVACAAPIPRPEAERVVAACRDWLARLLSSPAVPHLLHPRVVQAPPIARSPRWFGEQIVRADPRTARQRSFADTPVGRRTSDGSGGASARWLRARASQAPGARTNYVVGGSVHRSLGTLPRLALAPLAASHCHPPRRRSCEHPAVLLADARRSHPAAPFAATLLVSPQFRKSRLWVFGDTLDSAAHSRSYSCCPAADSLGICPHLHSAWLVVAASMSEHFQQTLVRRWAGIKVRATKCKVSSTRPRAGGCRVQTSESGLVDAD